MGLPVTDKNGIKGKPVHVALKSSPKDHHRPQFCHSLSIRIYLRRKITVPVRRFAAGIIKDILQRSIRSVFVQGYCYKRDISCLYSLSLCRSLSSYYQWTVMILRMPPAGRLHASIGFIRGNNRAAIFTRVDWTRCSIDPSAPSGRFASSC